MTTPAVAASLEKAREVSPPERAAVRHGLYLQSGTGQGLMACDKCACRRSCPAFTEGGRCELEREYTQERGQQLAQAVEASGGDPALASSLVASALIAEVRLGRAVRFLAEVGEFLPGADEGMRNTSRRRRRSRFFSARSRARLRRCV